MFKPFNVLLALLGMLGMVFLWSGSAVADPPAPVPESCLEVPAPAECLALENGGGTGDEGGGTSTGDDDTVPTVTYPPTPTGEPLVTGETQEAGETGETTGENRSDASAAAAETPEPTGSTELTESAEATQDPASCIEAEVAALVTDLTALLGADFAGLVAEIEGGLSDPAGLPTFLAGLPALIEDSGAEFSAELAGVVSGAADGLLACLPTQLPPCEVIEDFPLCIPDCAFIAELLGQEGCDFPECIDLTTIDPAVAELIGQLPEELLSELPICPPPGEEPSPAPGPTPVADPTQYENCDDARARGAAPVYASDPGYGPHLDADGDGIGCEDDTVVPAGYDSGGGRLAYTGAEFGPQITYGVVLLLLGSAFLLVSRRRA